MDWLGIFVPTLLHERSAEERLTEFLRQEFAAMKIGPRKTKLALREVTLEKIAGLSFRMFEQIWTAETPPKSRKWRFMRG
jgi:hypothetical protein